MKRYISTSALKRVAKALPELEPWAIEALAYHLALERELDAALARLLPRSDRLFQFRFGQKVSILQATTSVGWIDAVAKGLIAFDHLRNAAAHYKKVAPEKLLGNIRSAVAAITPDVSFDKATIGGMAVALIAALAVDVEARAKSSRRRL